MIEMLVIYLIVSVAAVWVLWSVLLPVRLRRVIRRRLTGRADVVAASTGVPGCNDADCPGCGPHD